jgi:excisionase family DNA binding protein
MARDGAGTPNGAAELLTVQEVAALCRVSTDSVYRAIQRGDLEAEEIFGCLRIRRSALKQYRRERRRQVKRRFAEQQADPWARQGSTGSLRALMRGERRRAA